jgi:hypothetical protein
MVCGGSIQSRILTGSVVEVNTPVVLVNTSVVEMNMPVVEMNKPCCRDEQTLL